MTTFAVVTRRIAEKVKGQADVAVRKATFELFRNIVLRSPVGNPSLWQSPAPKGYVGGQFRANWNFSVGKPNLTTIKSTRQQRGLQQATKALSVPAGGIVWLSNGLPYAKRLEDGWSTQAPTGMVKVSVAEFDLYLKRVLRPPLSVK